jgi:hypothetical protein
MKKRMLRELGLLLMAFPILTGCNQKPSTTLSQNEVVLEWARMALHITKTTPANSPTFASRGFGYIGLTMYESIVQGYPDYESLAGQLNGLNGLPVARNDQEFNWILCLNAAQAAILKAIYIQTSDENKVRIDSLEEVIYRQFAYQQDKNRTVLSVAYGRQMAEAIFKWSLADGGHRGYLSNFDKKIKYPVNPGSWKPPLFSQSFSHLPLHPHWGSNRTFLLQNSGLSLPATIPYDTLPDSPYYQEFLKVYQKEQQLTREEKEAAIWWGDDPDATFTPPGHSFYLATVAIETSRPPLIDCVRILAGVGMATADAFINCWKWKYHYFSERANTYIPRYIDEEWQSFWPDPPFPAFPSGHAIQAAAAATVLEAHFGKEFHLVDRAHEGRPRDEVRNTDFVVRSFNSFWQAARETADSRFYGGIHTRLDNEVGLQEGVKIGRNVSALHWKKTLPQ